MCHTPRYTWRQMAVPNPPIEHHTKTTMSSLQDDIIRDALEQLVGVRPHCPRAREGAVRRRERAVSPNARVGHDSALLAPRRVDPDAHTRGPQIHPPQSAVGATLDNAQNNKRDEKPRKAHLAKHHGGGRRPRGPLDSGRTPMSCSSRYWRASVSS